MWDESLIESRKGKRRSWFTLPVAFLAHALVVCIVIGASYWSIGAVPAPVVPPPDRISIFIPKDPGDGGPMQRADKPPKISAPSVQQTTPPLAVPVPETSNLNLKDTAPATNTLVSNGNSAGASEISGPGGNGTGTGSGPGVSGGSPDSNRVMRITPEMCQPVLIRKVQPVYPRLAIIAHWEGIVILEAVISKTGTVEGLRILSSPQNVFSDAAVAAVQQWLYKPAMLNGRPISVYFTVTVKFELK